MKNYTVYEEPGIYAGWPANHGHWQWDNELLVGFVKGKYDESRGVFGHAVTGPLDFVQARSLDYGRSWELEETGIQEQFGNEDLKDPPKFRLGGDTIIRVRGVYDHGGDYIPAEGGFWLSTNRGKNWHGPFRFKGVEFEEGRANTSRTCVHNSSAFMSRNFDNHWGSDEVFRVVHNGEKFIEMEEVTSFDGIRAVMPSFAKWYIACRNRWNRTCFISLYAKKEGKWEKLSEIGTTGKNNGNPPALIKKGKYLFCVYANRTHKAILCRTSANGSDWSLGMVLRQGSKSDIGYPVLFETPDGILAVYYWRKHNASSIEATELITK